MAGLDLVLPPRLVKPDHLPPDHWVTQTPSSNPRTAQKTLPLWGVQDGDPFIWPPIDAQPYHLPSPLPACHHKASSMPLANTATRSLPPSENTTDESSPCTWPPSLFRMLISPCPPPPPSSAVSSFAPSSDFASRTHVTLVMARHSSPSSGLQVLPLPG